MAFGSSLVSTSASRLQLQKSLAFLVSFLSEAGCKRKFWFAGVLFVLAAYGTLLKK